MRYIPDIPRLPLPKLPCLVRGCYWQPTLGFLQELQAWLGQRPVLELFAGNGYLAAWLQHLGGQVTATSRLSGMDAHAHGVYCPIRELTATEAVDQLGADHAVLLLCWPTVTEAAIAAVRAWGREKPVIFIGERTDYTTGFLGGCATDCFFAETREVHRFSQYAGRAGEVACVLEYRG